MAKRCDRCKQDWPAYMWYCPDCGIVLDKPEKGGNDKSKDDVSTIKRQDDVFTIKRKDEVSTAIVPGTEDLMENW